MPVVTINHPLVTHKMTILRDIDTSTKKFREVVDEITLLLTYEATSDLELEECDIETPLCPMRAQRLNSNEFVIAPILRAGLGMAPGMLDLIPHAKIAHIGLKRDEETAVASTYYSNIPSNLENSTVIVVDPMLATAGTMCAALGLIKELHPKAIKAICLIAAPEGARRVTEEHPDVDVYVAAMDEKLNEKCYIVPGLGDAGDRIFGTL